MPRLSREQSREITREKLRASAIREISATGFVGASIDRICESAGFSRGAFYANFKNKEALLLDIMRTHHNRETESWIALLHSDKSLAELLPTLHDRFSAYLADHNRIMFVTEVQLYARRNRAFLLRYNEEFLALNVNAEKVLEAVFDKAGKRPSLPLSQLAKMMQSLLTGVVLDIGCQTDPPVQSAELLVLFLQNLLDSGEKIQ